ncbi:ricin-type beta-trefoil lectin domain protein [Streptomyces sp. NPDC005752]|uniref:ricin-type beta-trefoil lectin domain protein n=1 Tax=Streptomyces sp. NPDC005752 TaxID=3157065 RepID=UPI0033EAA4B6
MTSSSQHPPASPKARVESSASGGEESAVGTAPTAPAAPTSGSAGPATGADAGKAGTRTTEAEKASGGAEKASGEAAKEPGTTGKKPAGPAAGTTADPEAGDRSDSESEADHGGTAAAQSRLPALVRTMTATAIGRPEQDAGTVGRPGKAVLAGAAVAGALLVSVPFLILVGNDDKGPEQPSVAAAGTVLDGSGPEAPGDFAVTPAETTSPAEDKKKDADEPVAEKPVEKVPVPEKSKDVPKKAAEPEEQPKKESAEKKSDGAKKQPVKAAPAVTLSGPVSFRSHLSGRCIDVPGHDFSDGKALHVWDCNGAPAQKWQFASDGTIRIKGLCLDVANANFSDGTPIQIAWCNGNAAQKFALNGAHDLVNTVVGMCVDIAGANRNSGASLQLLHCSGNSAQKWST